jgi:hypothetical protein
MRTRINIKTICTLLVMGLLLAACSASVQTVVVTATTAPTAIIIPTATSKPTIQPTPALPKMVVYTHPSNSFTISVPEDWTKTENNGYVLLSSTDQSAFVELAAENTNIPLSAEAFTSTINAFEYNVFSPNKNYKEASRDVQVDKGYGLIGKTLDINKIPFRALTIYMQEKNALYIQSYYSTESAKDDSAPILKAMSESFKTNTAYITDLSPFTSYPITFTDPNNLFSLWVPSLWKFEDTKQNGSVLTYTSPDSNGIIMLVKIDMGKTVTRTLADTTALEFLKSIFSDNRVAKTEVLKNGSIQMSWAPKSGGVQGLSIYKWSGTYWYFLTWMANAGFETVYGPVFNQSIGSYTIPE